MNEGLPMAVSAEKPLRSRRISWLLWLAGLSLIAILTWRMLDNGSSRPGIGRIAPDFNLQYYNGYTWNDQAAMPMSDFRGKVVVLNFWASWCVECRDEAPALEQLWREYADRGVVILGVAYSDTESKALASLGGFGITYPNAPDLRLHASDAYGLTGVPETFVIGPDGAVAYMKIGPITGPELAGVLSELLPGVNSSQSQ